MKKSIFNKLSNEKLVDRRNYLNGVLIGLGSVALIALLFLAYLLISHGFTDISAVAFIPILVLPITFLPMMIFLSQLNSEIKSRNIE